LENNVWKKLFVWHRAGNKKFEFMANKARTIFLMAAVLARQLGKMLFSWNETTYN